MMVVVELGIQFETGCATVVSSSDASELAPDDDDTIIVSCVSP